MRTYYTYDLKLASILVTLGVPIRKSDPVTCVEGVGNKKTYNFWFDTTDQAHFDLVTDIVRAHGAAKEDITKVKLDPEHPFFYAHAALSNREVLMDWIRNTVVPMRVIEHGDRTLLISTRASKRTQALMRGALRGEFGKVD